MTKLIIVVLTFIASMFFLGLVEGVYTHLINAIRFALIAISVISGFLIIVFTVSYAAKQ